MDRIPEGITAAIWKVVETQQVFAGMDRHPSNRQAIEASFACSNAIDALNAEIRAALSQASREQTEEG